MFPEEQGNRYAPNNAVEDKDTGLARARGNIRTCKKRLKSDRDLIEPTSCTLSRD